MLQHHQTNQFQDQQRQLSIDLASLTLFKNNACCIDVCHEYSKGSIIGITATINRELSKYVSHVILQGKREEIIQGKNIKEALNIILSMYERINGDLPNHIIIYRDGVGESQRKLVMNIEFPSIQECIQAKYNKLSHPVMTEIIVNKRINQRFFAANKNSFNNPEEGTLVQSEVVCDEASDSKFDFYLCT